MCGSKLGLSYQCPQRGFHHVTCPGKCSAFLIMGIYCSKYWQRDNLHRTGTETENTFSYSKSIDIPTRCLNFLDYADRTQTCLPLFTNAIHIASRYGSYVGRLQVEEGMILRQLYSDRSVYYHNSVYWCNENRA